MSACSREVLGLWGEESECGGLVVSVVSSGEGIVVAVGGGGAQGGGVDGWRTRSVLIQLTQTAFEYPVGAVNGQWGFAVVTAGVSIGWRLL